MAVTEQQYQAAIGNCGTMDALLTCTCLQTLCNTALGVSLVCISARAGWVADDACGLASSLHVCVCSNVDIVLHCEFILSMHLQTCLQTAAYPCFPSHSMLDAMQSAKDWN